MLHVGDDGTVVISSRHVWLPGVYADTKAARYAFRFADDDLQRLQDSLNPGGVITFDHLKSLRQGPKE